MSNKNWEKLLEKILEENNEIYKSWENPEVLKEVLEKERFFVKSSKKIFKINKNFKKISDEVSINFSLNEYKILKNNLESHNLRKDIYDKALKQNDSELLMLKWALNLENFIEIIHSNNNELRISILKKIQILKESVEDFLNGLKQYMDLENKKLKSYSDNLKSVKEFNEQEIINKMFKITQEFRIDFNTKSKSIFEEEIKIFQTFYGLIDKIIWEYKTSTIPKNFIEKLKSDYSLRTFITEVFRKDDTPFEFWMISNFNEKENEIILKKEKSILKTKYDNRYPLIGVINFRNDFQHRLIPEYSNQSTLATHTLLLIGILFDLINSIENIV